MTNGILYYKHIISAIRPCRSLLCVSGLLHKTFPPTICWSVCLSSVCVPVQCIVAKRFGMVGRTRLWMRQIVGFGDRSTGSDNFGANSGRPIVTNGNRPGGGFRSDTALSPNYFGQPCYSTVVGYCKENMRIYDFVFSPSSRPYVRPFVSTLSFKPSDISP